jgi:CheY-like chemotaxis protein
MSQENNTTRLCLCVELDADFYYLIRSYAERSGCRTELINRTSEVMQKARTSSPVVFFLEQDHPIEAPLWELLSEIKGDPSTKNIPVILFSWLDDEESAIEGGVDVFVRKPVMYADFKEALASAGVSSRTDRVDLLDSKRR